MGNNASQLQFKLIDSKQDAIRLLEEAETNDLYLSECHDHRNNSYSRRTLNYAPNTMQNSDVYKVTLLTMMNQIPEKLKKEVREVNIIELMPSADGGMPHTRAYNIICYPDISQVSSISTLVHELWHVHQRNFQDEWTNVFNRLGWKEWKGTLPVHLDNNYRYNPDTIDTPLWTFNEWLPLPIFNDVSFPNMKETTMWFYNINNSQISKKIPESLSSYFPNLPMSAYEHPRELTAYMLSDPISQKDSKGYADLLKYIGSDARM